jgi:tetraacyldisaccharide 4'-kinase
LFAQAGFPVAVAERRADAVAALAGDVNLVIADDGLQHYRMHRDAELMVIDGQRGFGNERSLPAGPVRHCRELSAKS